MFGVGIPEIIVILVVALVVLGPDRLPEVARMLGRALGELRRATSGLTDELRDFQRSVEQENSALKRSTQPRPRVAAPVAPSAVTAAAATVAPAVDAPAAPAEAPAEHDDRE